MSPKPAHLLKAWFPEWCSFERLTLLGVQGPSKVKMGEEPKFGHNHDLLTQCASFPPSAMGPLPAAHLFRGLSSCLRGFVSDTSLCRYSPPPVCPPKGSQYHATSACCSPGPGGRWVASVAAVPALACLVPPECFCWHNSHSRHMPGQAPSHLGLGVCRPRAGTPGPCCTRAWVGSTRPAWSLPPSLLPFSEGAGQGNRAPSVTCEMHSQLCLPLPTSAVSWSSQSGHRQRPAWEGPGTAGWAALSEEPQG